MLTGIFCGLVVLSTIARSLNVPTGPDSVLNDHQDPFGILCHSTVILSKHQETVRKLYRYHALKSPNTRESCMYIGLLLLALSNDVEMNPGPRPPKYPCGHCGRAVTYSGDGIQCDGCDTWFHRKCTDMTKQMYKVHVENDCYSWSCLKCGIPNFSSSFFETSTTDANSNSTFNDTGDPIFTSTPIKNKPPNNNKNQRAKVKLLNINLRSIVNKVAEFQTLIDTEKPDIVVGTETWLSPDIRTSEFLPEGYTLYREDRSHKGYCQLLRLWTRYSRGLSTVITQPPNAGIIRCHASPVSAWQRCLCTAPEVSQESGQPERVVHLNLPEDTCSHLQVPFRTSQDDPTQHTMDLEGLFYNVHKEDYIKYFQYRGQWPDFIKNVKTFNECAVMIRQPALEVKEMIDNMNLNHPAVRFVLYGAYGSGKTLSLSHIVHTYAKKGWFLVHFPSVIDMVRFKPHPPEVTASKYFDGQKYNVNEFAANWLKMCKVQNENNLTELKTTKEYQWTERESLKEGSSLLDLVTFGMERRLYASDCIGILMREVKIAAREKKIKMLVAVDGINGLFQETGLRSNEKKVLNGQDITFMYYITELFQSDWNNGACASTVCPGVASTEDVPARSVIPYTPKALLHKQGFEFMDPFIPVLVPNYSSKEIYNCLEYYMDRKWIQRPEVKTEDGKKQLIFLSNRNPMELSRICRYW